MNVLNREIQNVFFDGIFRKEIRIIRINLSEIICFKKQTNRTFFYDRNDIILGKKLE